MEDEVVKEQMVKWPMNFNKEIAVSSLEYSWKNAVKISTCTKLKENCYKMRDRCI